MVPRTSVVVARNGDWVGVAACPAWWCAVLGGPCLREFSCMDGERECVLAPAALVRSFRDRHPELVAALLLLTRHPTI